MIPIQADITEQVCVHVHRRGGRGQSAFYLPPTLDRDLECDDTMREALGVTSLA